MISLRRFIAWQYFAILLLTANTWGAETLRLSALQDLAGISIEMTREERDWLRQHPRLHVGVYPQQHSPLAQTMATGRFQGINAEYLNMFRKTLQTEITILRYEDKAQALMALEKGEIDTLLTGLDSQEQNSIDPSVIASHSVVHAWPNLVASMRNITAPLASQEPVTIARVGMYPNDGVIRDSFPHAQIVSYPEYGDALDSVATGKNDYFAGDSFSTSRWLSQEFSSELAILKYWASPQKQSVFLFRKENERLRDLVNKVLHHMPESLRLAITQQAIDSGNPAFLVDPLPLTAQEQRWLTKHKTVRVIVNPWFVPFTLLDSEKQIRGISGDLLNFISLQTGIQFETVVVTSHQQLLDEMHKGGAYIVQPAVLDNRDDAVMRYSHPFVNTQFVVVVNKTSGRHPQLEPGMRVAISEGHILDEALRSRYPDITWLTVDNVSIALNLLANGKVDGVIANRLSARYLRQHYYPDQLSWAPLPNADPAAFAFGFPLKQPLLQSIVNKVLERIPQGETLKIVSKWMRLPEAKVDTWELYNKPFYLVILLGTLLVLSSSLWAIYLFVEVRKRKRSQRMLVLERNNAQRANKENREFLSRMSHEIRTPVSAIMGFLELLQLSASTFKRDDRSCIEQAAKASRSLLKLIGNVLDLDKIESGALDVVPKWGKVDTLLNGKVALFQALATKKGIHLAYHSQLNTHDMMLIDYQLLGQVLNNVIGNALKFTQQGSVMLNAQYEAGTLTLSIQDTGPGISQYEQTRLFNPFYQGEAVSQQQGSGLGLTISRALMLKMGGTLLLCSELQRGTTLTIRLPVKVSRHPNSLPLSPPVAPKHFREDIRVLIVDDQAASRLLLYRQLEVLGIKAQQAENGQQALIQLQHNSVDLVITDINMPALDGVTLTQRARDLGITKTFICGLTATAQEHERQRCLAAGMNECLFKPLDLSQLSILLSKIADEVPAVFDMARLTMLTQGNRGLMLKALQDALQENYRDFAALRAGALVADYPTMKFHVHRINGTALLLGARSLASAALQLEDCLEQAIPAHELPAMLDNLETLLVEFDREIAKFTP